MAVVALGLVLSCGLLSCGAEVVGLPSPSPTPPCEDTGNYRVCKGLDYVGDGDSGHKMDLYLPSSSSLTSLPAVVWAQGTAFHGLPYSSPGMGSAKVYPCPQLTEVGIACAAMAYRGGSWPSQHQDIRAAVRWLRGMGKQGKYGLGGKIGAHGDSSGGNMAGHIWTSGHLEDEKFGADFTRIGPFPNESAAVASAAIYWPQYHLDPDDEPACEYSAARVNPHGPASEATYSKSSKDVVKLMNGQTYLDSSTVPAYMVVGTKDTRVSPCNTVEAYAAAKAKGVDVNVTYVMGGDHGCAVRGPVWANGCTDCRGPDPDVLKVMLAFFEKHLKGTAEVVV